jgi:positive regulator of sigma E activity
MTDIKGIVIKRQGERAEVKVDKTKSTGSNLPKYLDCWNPVNAKAGEVVGVEYQELDKRKAQLIMYGLPVLGLLAGAAFGNSLAIFFHMDRLYFILGGVVLWLLVAINYARIFKRDAMRQGKQPVIVEIEVQKMVIDMGDNPGK